MESAKWYIGRMHARERAQKTAEKRAALRTGSICSSSSATPLSSPTSTWSSNTATFDCSSPTATTTATTAGAGTSTRVDQFAALNMLRVPKWSPSDVSPPLSPSSIASDEAAEVHDRPTSSRQFTALELLGRVAAMG